MAVIQSEIETLLAILESVHNPEMLDTHPWVFRTFVQDAIATDAGFQSAGPGRQLVGAIEILFSQTMPSVPPRRGKRLDTRWGEFGLMAARYFAPLRFGTPVPGSLRDAWGRIDAVILLYVFGRGADSLTDEQVSSYKLMGDEMEVAPPSTLSDWHRKGVQRLAETIRARDQHLKDHPAQSAQLKNSVRPSKDRPGRRSFGRTILPILFTLLLLILGFGVWGGIKTWQIYNQAKLVWKDASQLKSLVSSSPDLNEIKQAGPSLAALQTDFRTLKSESQPFLWMGRWLGWVPVYGGDLSSAQDLMTLSDSLLTSADFSYQAASPLLRGLSDSTGSSGLTPSSMIEMLLNAQPQLASAQNELNLAVTARDHLDVARLSPNVRDVLLNDVDPLITLMQNGLAIGMELPRVMGSTGDGPKTYLLLVQNSDELRPTGGFITAAGTLLLQDGQVGGLSFQNSGDLDNWSRPYPTAPWQLQDYMDSPVLIFRDTNWFTNYPKAALYAEDLYSYYSGYSENGVIAFDQQFLVEILGVLGPVQVEDAPYPISAGNVIAYMRAAKTPTSADLATPGWNNKIFMNHITRALLDKIFSGNVPWKQVAQVLIQSLNEHHILLKLDDPVLTSFLASRGWDGVVRPGSGDFLMVVDSNVGFNKTNALVDTRLSYNVDLTNTSTPFAQLDVVHQNNTHENIPCLPRQNDTSATIGAVYYEEDYPIDRCYWDYLRVYMVAGTQLLDSTPESIPAEWTILQDGVPPHVDVLDEGIAGVQAFGTLKVVPGGQSVDTGFQFALPVGVIKSQPNSSQKVYHLRVQKQPGTLAVPITILVHLPDNSTIQTVPAGAKVQDHTVLLQTNLSQDLEFDIVFTVP
jgi:hypothetical protein